MDLVHASEFRRCLEQIDVAGIRALWQHVAPNMPQPTSDNEALTMLHRARTEANSLPFKLRAYSHSWLCERGYPSGLPDALKPKAERLYPRVVGAVGYSVNFRSPILAPAAPIIQQAVADVIQDAYAEGRTDPVFVKARMNEARVKVSQHLFGTLDLRRVTG